MTLEQVAWSAVLAAPNAGLELLGGRRDRWAQWSRAVCVMAAGDYAGAMNCFESLRGGDDEVAGLAAAAIASGLRRLDEHAAAIPFDERAATMPGRAGSDGLWARSQRRRAGPARRGLGPAGSRAVIGDRVARHRPLELGRDRMRARRG